MKVAFGTDERTSLTDAVRCDLEARGHDVIAAADGEWAAVGARVGELVASGECATGVLFCWTGTGASIAANKVRGVRAALCTDAATAAGAREWNDANVLVMGYMGLVTEDASGGHPRRLVPHRAEAGGGGADRPTGAGVAGLLRPGTRNVRGAERCRHVGVTRGHGRALPSGDRSFGPGLTESTGSSIGAFTAPGG